MRNSRGDYRVRWDTVTEDRHQGVFLHLRAAQPTWSDNVKAHRANISTEPEPNDCLSAGQHCAPTMLLSLLHCMRRGCELPTGTVV